ncbi:hypothetical protein SOPP22_01610 [Shewanella sp. OPT22]|nr:hypothetical protein SOPP22_01610 [Shewanella sp. OPT22]
MDLLNILNAIVGIIAGIIAIIPSTRNYFISLFKKFFRRSKDEDNNFVAARFITLFESHGVHRNQIPEFFDHGIQLVDCSSRDNLLPKLTSQILRDAADLFAIQIEWLQGASEQVYSTHNFYKQPESCIKFIKALNEKDSTKNGYLFIPNTISKRNHYDAAIVICEEIGSIGDKPINRLHIIDGWVYSYWKCRGYLTSCASLFLNSNIWLHGRSCDTKWLSDFAYGNLLPEYDFICKEFKFKTSKNWYVDEFIETPILYLKGVDPERDNFGHRAAISLWLELESKGYIPLERYSSRSQVRQNYENFSVT